MLEEKLAHVCYYALSAYLFEVLCYRIKTSSNINPLIYLFIQYFPKLTLKTHYYLCYFTLLIFLGDVYFLYGTSINNCFK